MLKQSGLGPELLGAISNLVCVVKDGRIAYINTAGMNMLGAQDGDDVIGHPLADFVHADYAELIALGIEVFAEEDAGVPLKLKPLKSSSIDVHMRVRLLEAGEGETYMVECRDISSFIKASQEAREREQRLAGVLGTVMDAIITIDADGLMQTVNTRTESMFGYEKKDMLGHHINMLLPTEYREHHENCVADSYKVDKKSTYGVAMEMEGQTSQGLLFHTELSVTELHEGRRRLFTWVIRDITDRKKALAELEHMAHHDTLTGLPNRNLFNDLMKRAIQRCTRTEQLLAVMFVDLDKFKPVNDDLGHDAGDAVLKAVAQRMASHVRSSDTVARIGGDEFVAILENIDHAESAAIVAQKIITSLTEPVEVDGGLKAQIGASIGISIFPDDGTTADALIKGADQAMYAVKAAGRNNFKFFNTLKSTEK
ncbi:MAG: response regulator [Rhodospirillaceae bacterium]|nr:MAG: response regulator [Rhodospirillaceae bacterium]